MECVETCEIFIVSKSTETVMLIFGEDRYVLKDARSSVIVWPYDKGSVLMRDVNAVETQTERTTKNSVQTQARENELIPKRTVGTQSENVLLLITDSDLIRMGAVRSQALEVPKLVSGTQTSPIGLPKTCDFGSQTDQAEDLDDDIFDRDTEPLCSPPQGDESMDSIILDDFDGFRVKEEK